MGSIDKIKASDGSGNASVATVQNSRSPGSSTIVVDTVDNINDNFMGSMGTPHTFVDPITSETITVISEATCVDFSGHVDGSNLEIDAIAPGQTDLGSDVDDIIVIRPTTQWGDNVADVLEEAHNDDGSAKNLSIDYNALTDNLKKGWISAGETWTYTSWDSANVTGVIAVPTGAASRYSLGMKIRIAQSTGGTKYGFITKIADTALTIYFGTDYTLNNEAITVPFYSTQKAPYGFPMDPLKWTVTVDSTTGRSTTSTSLASMTDKITVPIGSFRVCMDVTGQVSSAATTSFVTLLTLSTDGSTVTNPKLTARLYLRLTAAATGNHGEKLHLWENVMLTTATDFLLMGQVNNANVTLTVNATTEPGAVVQHNYYRAVCNYL